MRRGGHQRGIGPLGRDAAPTRNELAASAVAHANEASNLMCQGVPQTVAEHRAQAHLEIALIHAKAYR